MSARKHLGFFFGSGISMKAGLASCSEMTTEILTGKNIYFNNGGKYQIGRTGKKQHSEPVDERILMFLQILKTEADFCFYGRRPANYEDLFYMVWLVLGIKSGQVGVENPAATRLIREIDKMFEKFYGNYREHTEWERDYYPLGCTQNRLRIDTLARLAQNAYNYISDYVCTKLVKPNPNVGYFKWIRTAVNTRSYTDKWFYTLNNDLLLETYFSKSGVRYSDGFSPPLESNQPRYWDRGKLKQNRVVIIKLHGSINWSFLTPEEFSVGDIASLPSLRRKLLDKPDPVSEFLAARLNTRTHASLEKYRPSAKNSEKLEKLLIENLNRIISTPKIQIYDTARFQNVRLRGETKELLETCCEGSDLIRLNRMLLEDAFPMELPYCKKVVCFSRAPLQLRSGRPIILLGRNNKEIDYFKPIFEDLHFQFDSALRSAKLKRLIVCGYGFGDNVINLRLKSWLRRSSANKMVLIHPKPEECLKGFLGPAFMQWIEKERVVFIRKYMETVSWNDILNKLKP